MICVIGITDVLLARIAVGDAAASMSAKICCLSARFSGPASNTTSASAIVSVKDACPVTRSAAAASWPRSLRFFVIRSCNVARTAGAGS